MGTVSHSLRAEDSLTDHVPNWDMMFAIDLTHQSLMTANSSRSRRRYSRETAVGPLMDRSGNVIGVIQSKLNALLMAPQLGPIPENISFCSKGFDVNRVL